MNKKIYLVDFFDTIMFRHIHPFQLLNHWATNIKKKFELKTSINDILKIRKDCFANLNAREKEDYYSSAIKNMYEQLIANENNLEAKVKSDEFLKYSKDVECGLECAVQYPNTRLINKLKKVKLKGAKVYIVSDFHLGKNELKSFLQVQNIDVSLFDEIYVSSDCRAEKVDGTLYKYVIDQLKFTPKQAVMIGDNVNSDKKQAEKFGIKTIYKKRFFHKVKIHLRMKYLKNNSNYISKKFIKDCYKYRQPFAEYIVLFHSFIERLYDINNRNKVVFLSREGWFLKRLFDLYVSFHCSEKHIPETFYFLCSRMAITSVQIDKIENNGKNNPNMNLHNYLISAGIFDEKEEKIIKKYNMKSNMLINKKLIELVHPDIEKQVSLNKEAFLKYASNFLSSNDCNNIVDIGWNGTMQLGLENILGIKFKGFYFGTKSDDDSNYPIEKNGLIFSNNKSNFSYYDILRTNIQLYELLSAAPHGAARTYVMDNETSEVIVPLFWEENEKRLYEQVIKVWQENAEKLFIGYTIYINHEKLQKANKRNAKIVLKNALFADKNRLTFLRKLDEGFFWNFTKQTSGIKYNPKSVKINFSIIYAPERYVRFFAKIQRLLPNKKIVQLIYKLFAYLFYTYVLLIISIKKFIYLIKK